MARFVGGPLDGSHLELHPAANGEPPERLAFPRAPAFDADLEEIRRGGGYVYVRDPEDGDRYTYAGVSE